MAILVEADSLCRPLSWEGLLRGQTLLWESFERSENSSPGSQMLSIESIESALRPLETIGLPALDSGPVT